MIRRTKRVHSIGANLAFAVFVLQGCGAGMSNSGFQLAERDRQILLQVNVGGTTHQTNAIRPRLEPATRDPFTLPPVQETPAVMKPQPATVAEAPPQPPSLNVRFEGRMIAPDGASLIFASLGEARLILAVGLALPNGYIVKDISPQAVEFIYPPLSATAVLALPPVPVHEVR